MITTIKKVKKTLKVYILAIQYILLHLTIKNIAIYIFLYIYIFKKIYIYTFQRYIWRPNWVKDAKKKKKEGKKGRIGHRGKKWL